MKMQKNIKQQIRKRNEKKGPQTFAKRKKSY